MKGVPFRGLTKKADLLEHLISNVFEGEAQETVKRLFEKKQATTQNDEDEKLAEVVEECCPLSISSNAYFLL